jgi:hypothetical protein
MHKRSVLINAEPHVVAAARPRFAAVWPCLLALLGMLALAIHLPAQESLRYSLASEQAARARAATANIPYNIKLGEARMRFAAGLGIEYNDNINVAETGQQDDLVLRPEGTVDVFWPITEQNSLNVSVNIGYTKFLENDQFDTLLIRPGSLLSFDFYVDNFRINLHDRFSFFQDPTQQGVVSGTNGFNAGYGVGENVIGVGVDWDLNKVILSVGYDHADSFATSSQFSFIDRSSELFYLRAGVLALPELTVGAEFTGGLIRFKETRLNDSDQFTFGPYVDWLMSQFMRLGLRAGYQTYSFDIVNTNILSAADTSSFYASLVLDHEVNRYVRYNLGAGHQVALGVNSDAVNITFARLAARWDIMRNTDISTDLFYEHGEETGSLNPETFNRVGFTLSTGYRLTDKLNGLLRYSITWKDSDVALRSYTQNVISLALGYRF